jgi:hypothetical protein
MTVSTSTTYEFNLSSIALLAYRKAGLVSVYQTLTAQQAGHALDELDLLVRSTHTMGLFAKVMRLENVTLVSGQRTYTLAADVLDVDGDGALITPGQPLDAAAGETPVKPISRERWQGLSNHGATGRPVEYFTDRTSNAILLYLWPTPDAGNAGTIRFQTHRLRANMRDGNATADFEPYWEEYFVTALAARLAMSHSMSLGRVKMLRDEAEGLLEKCRAQSQQRGSQQFTLAHRSGVYRGGRWR